ncbi:MAG: hypothetical protein FJ399_20345 [Verrucomicrobia bacterium]|nr:hypothetical protein [Verrucomicrobiota bacterium]
MRTLAHWSVVISIGLASVARLGAETKPGSWAELKEYHSVMSVAFHSAEDGNLEPVKTRSGELAEVSKKWLASKPPADFDQPAIKEKLRLLQAESAALDRLVRGKKASDAEIKETLFKLHDRFHEIVGACREHGGGAKK